MNSRIKQLREYLGKNQEKFGEELGLSRNYISLVENGQRKLSEQSFKVLCSLYNVNEDWLRNGTGEMFKPQTRNQEIFAFANNVMKLDDDKFKKRFVEALTRLDEKDWEALGIIAEKLLKEEEG